MMDHPKHQPSQLISRANVFMWQILSPRCSTHNHAAATHSAAPMRVIGKHYQPSGSRQHTYRVVLANSILPAVVISSDCEHGSMKKLPQVSKYPVWIIPR